MESLYDRALLEVGNSGKFQKKFDLLYNVILAVVFTIASNNIILILAIVPHTCMLPEKDADINNYSTWKSMHIPMEIDGSGIEKFSSCLIYVNHGANNDTKACQKYEYDKTWYESTIPSENNWVCDHDIYVANIFAYIKIGETVGALVFGWFGDLYGRKPTYIISLALLVFGRILSLISSYSYIIFTIGCIIASLPSTTASQSTALVSIETSSPKRRATMAKLRLVAVSFGMGLMPLLFWWLRTWRSFFIVTTILVIPFLLISWKILESPQWLWVTGNNKVCIKYLKYIAKINKTILDPDTEKEMLTATPIKDAEMLNYLALFSGWRLAMITILQLLFWICVSSNYSVTILSSAEKSDGNPFLEFSWQCLAEIPAHFLAAWLADRIGRRFTGVYALSSTAVLWTIFSFRENSTNEQIKNGWVGTFLIIFIKMSITMSYYVINIFNMELYPTCLRQSGMSLCNVISGGANAIGPYVLYLGRHYDNRLPGIILTVVSLSGAFVSYCLPETLNAKLPETLEDARVFGKNQKRYTVAVKIDDDVL